MDRDGFAMVFGDRGISSNSQKMQHISLILFDESSWLLSQWFHESVLSQYTNECNEKSQCYLSLIYLCLSKLYYTGTGDYLLPSCMEFKLKAM